VDRLERLVNLVAALLDAPRPLSRDDVRERVPGYAGEEAAFRRTFERDKDSLRQMGIPITVERLEGAYARPGEAVEGYRIKREQYELPDPGLEPDELAALRLAAGAVQLEGTATTAALWKLGAGSVDEDGSTHGDGAPDGSAGGAPVVALPHADHLAVLFGAIAERRTVRFSYRAEDREVSPFRLSSRNGHWYLTGHDHGREQQRSFRLDRFETAPVAVSGAGAFERPAEAAGPPPAPWALSDGDAAVAATLLVDASQAGWAVSEVGEAAVSRRHPDGAVELTLAVSNRAAFRSFALGFLEHAEVLAPPELRRDMVDWLTAMAAGR
jgi:proteasome accessory factor B